MLAFKCDKCGSTEFIEKDGMYICQNCGEQYPM